ncbi:MAG: hypothetical protein LBG91_02490 [Treponema sp.]|jgi:hypothetical protein|nr:hypothetical protein [Treponema sp.]
MYKCHSVTYSAIPHEYRKTAESLFPRNGVSIGQEPNLKTAVVFAKALGIGAEYQRLLALDKNSGDLRVFLDHFQNNLDLLIQKTWVEKAEESRKEKLQDKIPPFMDTIEQGDFFKAIEQFGTILEELAYLFFGIQSDKDDFTEYTFRIDVQMGLFWWYGGRLTPLKELCEKNNVRNAGVLWAILLLGLCYLTNF